MRWTPNAMEIIGGVYTLLGAIFAALGLGLFIGLKDEPGRMMGWIFGGIGGIFLILGILFLVITIRKRRVCRRLVESGRFLWAEISDCVPEYNITINGRHPYRIFARYCRGETVHLFRSEPVRGYPDASLIGQPVRVYVGDDTFRRYYVDLQGIQSRVVEHSF